MKKRIIHSVFIVILCVNLTNAPVALSIDELQEGNTDGEKYQCILIYPVNKVVLDIFPKRYESILLNTLTNFQKMNAVKLNTLFPICGNLTQIFHLFGLKSLLKLLTNIIEFGKLSGLLKLFVNSSRRNSANLIADVSRNPDRF